MKILSWNECGAGRKRFYLQLKAIINYCNRDILYLVETKVQSERAQKIIKSFNYSNFVEIPPKDYQAVCDYCVNLLHIFLSKFYLLLTDSFIH